MEFPNPLDSLRGLKTFGRLNTYHLCQNLYPQCSQFYLPSLVLVQCLCGTPVSCQSVCSLPDSPCISASQPSCFTSPLPLVCDGIVLCVLILGCLLPGSASHFCVRPPASSQIKDFAFRTMLLHLAPSFAPGPTLTSLHGLKCLEFLPAQQPGRQISPGFG